MNWMCYFLYFFFSLDGLDLFFIRFMKLGRGGGRIGSAMYSSVYQAVS